MKLIFNYLLFSIKFCPDLSTGRYFRLPTNNLQYPLVDRIWQIRGLVSGNVQAYTKVSRTEICITFWCFSIFCLILLIRSFYELISVRACNTIAVTTPILFCNNIIREKVKSICKHSIINEINEIIHKNWNDNFSIFWDVFGSCLILVENTFWGRFRPDK